MRTWGALGNAWRARRSLRHARRAAPFACVPRSLVSSHLALLPPPPNPLQRRPRRRQRRPRRSRTWTSAARRRCPAPPTAPCSTCRSALMGVRRAAPSGRAAATPARLLQHRADWLAAGCLHWLSCIVERRTEREQPQASGRWPHSAQRTRRVVDGRARSLLASFVCRAAAASAPALKSAAQSSSPASTPRSR